MGTSIPSVLLERIQTSIHVVRGERVMLSTELANLYGVTEKALNQSVKRNMDRFPRDFMFQLKRQEAENLRSHCVTSSSGYGGRRYLPYAFTEQGVAMLSSVLRSPRAVKVNIEIMRAFVRLRQLLESHADLKRKREDLEKNYDEQFKEVFDAIRQLMTPPVPKRKQIGFQIRERGSLYRVKHNGR